MPTRDFDKAHFITFGNDRFRESGHAFCRAALATGFDSATFYDYDDLVGTQFYRENRFILDQERGAGYWLWKPWIVLDKLSQCGPDDVVVYCDAGRGSMVRHFERFPGALVKAALCAPQGMMFGFAQHWLYQARFTRRDCFILMDADTEAMHGAPQVVSSCHIWTRRDFSVHFAEEWLRYARDPRCLTDQDNELGQPNTFDFQEHRHDQAIGSILVHKLRAPHFNLIDTRPKVELRALEREIGRCSQFPKRVFNLDSVARRVLPAGFEDAGPEEARAMAGAILEYLDPAAPMRDFNRLRSVPGPVIRKEAKALVATNPQALEWKHLRAQFNPRDIERMKELERGKRPEYVAFLREQFVAAYRRLAPERGVRMGPDGLYELVDHAAYPGDLNDIDQPKAGREAVIYRLRKQIAEAPESVDWPTVWRAMAPGDRKRWKAMEKTAGHARVVELQEELRCATLARADGEVPAADAIEGETVRLAWQAQGSAGASVAAARRTASPIS